MVFETSEALPTGRQHRCGGPIVVRDERRTGEACALWCVFWPHDLVGAKVALLTNRHGAQLALGSRCPRGVFRRRARRGVIREAKAQMTERELALLERLAAEGKPTRLFDDELGIARNL